MLQAFRQKGVTSAVYGLLIVAMAVVFVVQFGPGSRTQKAALNQECAAEVKGECIAPKDYYAALSLIAPARMIEAAQVRAMNLRKVALDGIVERTLLVKDAERLGLSVSEDDVNGELLLGRAHVSLPSDRGRSLAYSLRLTDDWARLLPVTNPDTKAFDYKTYDKVVRQFTNRSPTEFKAMQQKELLAAYMRDVVRSRVRVTDELAYEAYVREKSTATIRYVRFLRSWFARHGLDSSPDAVNEWGKKHEEEVSKVFESAKSQYLPECRRARHILVKVSPEATSDEKAEARAKLERAMQRLKKGDAFESVAREVSDDDSAKAGGDLGCFTKGKMVKPFEDAAFAMRPGETSPIVETQFGLHVLRLEAVYRDAEAEAYGRRESAKSLMQKQESESLAAEVAKKVLAAVSGGEKLDVALTQSLAALTANRPKSAERAPAAHKGETPALPSSSDEDDRPRVEVSGAFNAGGDPIVGVAPGQNVSRTAFALKDEGAVPADLVTLNDGYAVLQLKEKSDATREQYEKERETYLSAILAGRQSDALSAYVTRLREASKAEVKVNESYAKPPEKEKGAGDDEE